MENVYLKKVKNGYIVELAPYSGDDDLLYIYKTKAELLAALPGHIEEAHELKERETTKTETKEE